MFKFGVHFCIRLSGLVRPLFAKQNTAEITKNTQKKLTLGKFYTRKPSTSKGKRNISVARSGCLTESKGKFGYFN